MNTQHEKLVSEAVTLQKQLNALNVGPRKLSAKAFLQSALAIGDITLPRTREFKKILDESSNVDAVRSFVRMATTAFCSSNYPSPPPRRWSMFGDPTEVATQAGSIGYTLANCIALAALVATESRPECFGSVDDIAGHESKIKALQSKLESLHAKIIATATIDDLELIEASGDKFEIFFKLARVSLAPKHDAANRLVMALAA